MVLDLALRENFGDVLICIMLSQMCFPFLVWSLSYYCLSDRN